MEDAHDTPAGARPRAQHSFLVRFWRATPKGPWHFTLQRTAHEPAMHFAGVDLLFAFLLTQLGEDAPFLQRGDADQNSFETHPSPARRP